MMNKVLAILMADAGEEAIEDALKVISKSNMEVVNDLVGQVNYLSKEQLFFQTQFLQASAAHERELTKKKKASKHIVRLVKKVKDLEAQLEGVEAVTKERDYYKTKCDSLFGITIVDPDFALSSAKSSQPTDPTIWY